MPTPTKGPRLGGGPAHERLILANLAQALFEHDRITTTQAKAKRLRPLAERLVTFAKRGDLHARRRVLAVISDKGVVHRLFTEIAPDVAERQGGYTRITKIAPARATTPRWPSSSWSASRCRPSRPPSRRPRPRPRRPPRSRRPRRPRPRRPPGRRGPAEADRRGCDRGAVRRGLARPAGRRLGARGLRHQGQRGLEEVPHPRVALVRPDRGAEVWFATQEAAEAAGFEADQLVDRPPVRRGLARAAGRRLGARGLRHQGQRGLDEVPHARFAVVRPDGRRGVVRHRRGRRGRGLRRPGLVRRLSTAARSTRRARHRATVAGST